MKTLAARIHERAEGSPRGCMELSQYLLDRELVRYEMGSWVLTASLVDAELPGTLSVARREKLATLSADARELAEALALAEGAELDIEAFAELTAAGDRERVRSALDELLFAQVMRIENASLSVRSTDLAGGARVVSGSSRRAARVRPHRRRAGAARARPPPDRELSTPCRPGGGRDRCPARRARPRLALEPRAVRVRQTPARRDRCVPRALAAAPRQHAAATRGDQSRSGSRRTGSARTQARAARGAEPRQRPPRLASAGRTDRATGSIAIRVRAASDAERNRDRERPRLRTGRSHHRARRARFRDVCDRRTHGRRIAARPRTQVRALLPALARAPAHRRGGGPGMPRGHRRDATKKRARCTSNNSQTCSIRIPRVCPKTSGRGRSARFIMRIGNIEASLGREQALLHAAEIESVPGWLVPAHSIRQVYQLVMGNLRQAERYRNRSSSSACESDQTAVRRGRGVPARVRVLDERQPQRHARGDPGARGPRTVESRDPSIRAVRSRRARAHCGNYEEALDCVARALDLVRRASTRSGHGS